MNRILLRGVKLGLADQQVDVFVHGRRIAAVVPAGGDYPELEARIVDGSGCRVLPGLRDAHLHVGAWLRAQRSLLFPEGGLTPAVCGDWHNQARGGWTVAFGIDHQHDLDVTLRLMEEHLPGSAMVVHRTGHAALLNQAAARALGVGDQAMVSYARGMWGRALGPAHPSWEMGQLARLRTALLMQGVTSVHDATPYPRSGTARMAFLAEGLAPLKVDFMGDPWEPAPECTHRKVMRPLDRPPVGEGIPLAVHAVEPEEIAAALVLLGDAPGRIEHAAICPAELGELIARSGAEVCANPAFLLTRSAAYARVIDRGEGEFLQPVARLARQGVGVRYGSDAPVSPPGVWPGVTAATTRGGPGLPVTGEPTSVEEALSAVVGDPALLCGEPRSWKWRRADLALFAEGILGAATPDVISELTLVDGQIVYSRPAEEQ